MQVSDAGRAWSFDCLRSSLIFGVFLVQNREHVFIRLYLRLNEPKSAPKSGLPTVITGSSINHVSRTCVLQHKALHFNAQSSAPHS